MEMGQILKEVMAVRGLTQTKFAKMLGYSTPSGVQRILSGGNGVRLDALLRGFETLGYEVIVRPVRSGRKEDGAYVVTCSEKARELIPQREEPGSWYTCHKR